MTKTDTSLMPTYARLDVAFDHGKGTSLFDAKGKEYLDFITGIAVNGLGHAHPHLVKTLTDQASKLWHVSNMYTIPDQERLATRLTGASTMDTVFFTNSGVEAMECALKLARKYQSDQGKEKRYRIITFKNAFHGRSLATIAAAKKEMLTKGFGPMLQGFDQVPFFDLDAVRSAIGPETAGILIEPVQGEGGIFPVKAEDMQALREVADEHGLVLILDEIQCGMGRTGKMFAHEWSDIVPDIVASAKGIGGGFPLGACLATAKVGASLSAGSHGTTYGGNPLAMAVGNAVLDVMLEDGFFDHVIEMSKYLMDGLNTLKDKHPTKIVDVRGMGLMIGIELSGPNRPLQLDLIERGLLVGGAGVNVMRLLPALIVSIRDIDKALSVLDECLTSNS